MTEMEKVAIVERIEMVSVHLRLIFSVDHLNNANNLVICVYSYLWTINVNRCNSQVRE